jgi:probable HAF family extracellular repeat protein
MALARRVSVSTALAIASIASYTARAEYAVIDLGALINTATGTNASVRGINAAAQVAITNAPDALAYHAYQYSAGASLDLGTLGGSAAFALAINNAGQVAGRSITTAGIVHAFVWTPGGVGGIPTNPQMKDLTPAGGPSEATAINTTGQLTGYMTVPAQGQQVTQRAFRYSSGTITQLPLPTGNYDSSFAYGINDNGKVVGEVYKNASGAGHAFLYNGATSAELGDLGGGSSTPLAINNQDQIVGYSANLDGYDRAFLYNDAAMTDLGTLGGHYSYALAINGNNQIAGGSYTDDADSIYHAFLSDGTIMTDLNTQVTSKAADWVLNEAKGINDSGVIVGTGTLSGQRHAFMLRPLAPGDATADGSVDFNDLVALAQNYNTDSGSADWEHGDFTGDGNVDFNDLVLIAQNYNTTQFQSDIQVAFAPVPEPSACCTLALATLLAVTRRPRRVVA